MANEVLIKSGSTAIVFADHAGDFAPAAANSLEISFAATTDVQLSLASLADSAYRQSAQVDLGATRAPRFRCYAAFEMAATPTDGDVIHLYWAPKTNSTAANGNLAGASGSDAAYDGYSSNGDSAIKQAVYIGAFVCTVQITGTVQIAFVGEFDPGSRYGSLIVRNESAAAFHSDDVESHVLFEPVIDEVQ